jgi:5-methylcytosine-specific restriction endonuclease McrA
MSLRYAGVTPKLKPKPAPEPTPPKGSYAAYIASAEWRMRRIEILSQRGAQCERCPTRRGLQIHHKTYARLGRELPADLEILCNACHEREHGLRA